MENYYKVLGVDTRASLAEITDAFKARFSRLLRMAASDDVEKAKEKLKLAVTTLGNVEKRNHYDRLLAFQIDKEDKESRASQYPRLVTEMAVQCPFCPSNTYLKEVDPNQEYRCTRCNGLLRIPKILVCNMCDTRVEFNGNLVPCPKCQNPLHTSQDILDIARREIDRAARQLEPSATGDPFVRKVAPASPRSPAPGPVPPPPSAAPGPVSPHPPARGGLVSGNLEEITLALKKLKELVDMGILTPHEFEQKKKELLSRI